MRTDGETERDTNGRTDMRKLIADFPFRAISWLIAKINLVICVIIRRCFLKRKQALWESSR